MDAARSCASNEKSLNFDGRVSDSAGSASGGSANATLDSHRDCLHGDWGLGMVDLGLE